MRIRRLKVVGDEKTSNVLIKHEKKWLADDTHSQDLTDQEMLNSIKTEEDPFHTSADANGVQEFTPAAQTDEYLKTELMLDEELIDNMNDSETKCKQDVLADNQLVGAGDQPTDDDSINSNQMSTPICEEYGSSFTHVEHLNRHMLTKHSGKAQAKFKCGICSRSYTTKSVLKKHLRKHSKDRRRQFVCDSCGKTYYEKSDLNRHNRIHTGELYPCNVCGHRFTTKGNLKTHMIRRQHFGKPQQFTPQRSNNDVTSLKPELISDKEFIDEGNGSESIAPTEGTQQPALAGDNKQQNGVDTAVDSVTCEVCHNIYPGELIKAHMRLTHSDNAYKCQFCSRSCSTKGHLVEHLRMHSKDRKREFACDTCGKTFYEKNNLNKHKKIHTGPRYPCKVCGYRFTKKENLKIHMVRRQHFENPQQLTPQSSNNDVASMKTERTSDEEFIDEENGSELVSHAEETLQPAIAGDNKQRTGVDIARDSVTCEVCHNSYPGELIKVHMRLMHNQKADKCEFCSRSFTTKSVLKRHLCMHSKDRRREFACDLCGKTFYEKSSLKTHKKIHNGDGHPCKVCGQRFTLKSNLKRHMVRSKHFDDKRQQSTPQSSDNDVATVKTEVVSDEEFIDEGNGSASTSQAEETQDPARAGNNEQPTGVDSADETYKCQFCLKVYWKKSAFENHLSTHNDYRPRPYACEQCGSKFLSKRHLKGHMITHTKNRQPEFDCELCEKKFYSSTGLKEHMRTHTGKTVSIEV